MSSSWNRCAIEHGLDPEAKEPPRILTSRELKDHREPLDQLIANAGAELDRLHAVVGQARYIVLLCDAHGVAVDYRVSAADADLFRHWGIYLGGLWDEKVEGTNGIGTAITELWHDVWPLVVMGIVLIPLGVYVFGVAERYAKRTGKLKRVG